MGGPAGTSAQWREGVYTPVAGSFDGCRLSHCREACFVFCGVVCPVVLLSCPLLLWFLLCSPLPPPFPSLSGLFSLSSLQVGPDPRTEDQDPEDEMDIAFILFLVLCMRAWTRALFALWLINETLLRCTQQGGDLLLYCCGWQPYSLLYWFCFRGM